MKLLRPLGAAGLLAAAAFLPAHATEIVFGYQVGGSTPLTFFPGAAMGVEWATGRYSTQPSGALSGDIADLLTSTPARLALPAIGAFTTGLTLEVHAFAGANASTPAPFVSAGFSLIRPKASAFYTGDSMVFTFNQDVELKHISFISAAASESVEVSANGVILYTGGAYFLPANPLALGRTLLRAGQELKVRCTLSGDGYHVATLGVAKPGTPDAIHLPKVFASGSVLQRDKIVPLWGRARPGETVTASIRAQTKSAVADASGNFEIRLDPEPAGGPLTLTVSGTHSLTVTSTNVYYGDVWLCGGQSNMWYRLVDHLGATQYPNAYGTIPNATDNFETMRFAMAATETSATARPDNTLYIPWSAWKNVPLQAGASFNWMSALPYFFAKALKAGLDANGQGHVPIGILIVAFGGTSIEQWIPADAINANGPWPSGSISPSLVGNCYNAMLAPIDRFPIKGALWYQGENNSGNHVRVNAYAKLQELLAASWRATRDDDFPFYFVQLAGYMRHSPIPKDNDASVTGYNINWAWIREAQTKSLLTIPNSAMVVSIDTGDQGNIHPSGKDLVGQRLATLALARDYGVPLVHRGPRLVSQQIVGSDVILTFDNVGGGLKTRTVDAQPDATELTKGFPAVRADASMLRGFAIAGANQVFYHATRAEIIAPNQIRLSNTADVPSPVAVRYAWQSFPNANLFGGTDLPAEPFRTDSFTPDTSTGADSTPVAQPVAPRQLLDPAAATTLTFELDAIFQDLEDGDAGRALTFTVTGNSDATLVTQATITGSQLTLTCAARTGAATITLRATDAANRSATAQLDVSVDFTAFVAWQREHFTAAQLADPALEATLWGATADPDADGHANLLEFATASHPLAADAELAPLTIIADGGHYIVRYRRAKRLDDDPRTTLELQSSTGLTAGTWTVVSGPTMLHADLGDAELRETTLVSPPPSLFVRLAVSRD